MVNFKQKEIGSFNSLIDLIEYFDTEQKCIDYLTERRWLDNIECPHCKHEKVYKFSDKKRYKCASCREQFTVKTDSIFEDTKIALRKWFIAIYLVTSHKKGISSHQLAKDIKVTQKTAWFMLHRIRFGLGQDNLDLLEGEVEIDETYVGGKNKNRHESKKISNAQGRSVKDKTPVLGMVERQGILKAVKVINTQSTTLQPIILNNVCTQAKIMTDEWWGYAKLNRVFNHAIINHGQKEFVRNDVHTNTIEGFWSLFKRSIIGIYHSASDKHIQKYIDEAVFRYNTRKMREDERVSLTLSCTGGKRLTYNTLIQKTF
jgi:transposase-like protein